MTTSLLEATGLLLLVVSAGLTTAAAYTVALPLALLVAGVWALFLGVVMVIVANALEQRRKAPPR